MHSYQDKINELNNLYNDGQFLNVAQKAAYYLKENENWFEVWNLLGASKFALGQFLGASEAFNKTISLNPSFVEGYVNLGLALKNLNKLNDAIKCFRNAIRLYPDHFIALNEVGNILKIQGNFEQAIEAYEQALTIKTDYAEAYNNKGLALKELGMLDEALKFCQKAIFYNPTLVAAFINKGNILKAQQVPNSKDVTLNSRKINEAIESYKEAIKINPNFGPAYVNLANSLTLLDRDKEALDNFEQAIHIDPTIKETYLNIGNVLKKLGRLDEAENAYKKALEIDPSYNEAFSNMLFSMLNNTKYSVEELSKEHQKYSKYFEKNKSNGRIIFTNERSKNKVLNVGFVSGDFRDHPVSDYFTPVLASIAENSSIRTFGYYNYNVSDGRTAELKKYFFKWRSIWGISDKIVINKIKNDKIDILIDLSGHTAYNRLKLFTKKPAPVQASMFGYPFTTGLKSIDYFIGAKNAFSERYKQNFSEKIVELPYNPPYLPKTKELQIENFPIFSNKHITFGSFFNVNKLNSEVLELWTSIMNNIPSSRLVVGNVSGIETEQRLINIFKKQNISGKRLDFIPKLNYPEFLKMHNKIDVCLAPFPNSGGTTILCALWMGVPTLILSNSRYLTNGGANIMKVVGCPEFVVTNKEEYLKKAYEISNNLNFLNGVKTKLIKNARQSELFNAEDYSLSFTDAIRKMWQLWCLDKKPKSFSTF